MASKGGWQDKLVARVDTESSLRGLTHPRKYAAAGSGAVAGGEGISKVQPAPTPGAASLAPYTSEEITWLEDGTLFFAKVNSKQVLSAAEQILSDRGLNACGISYTFKQVAGVPIADHHGLFYKSGDSLAFVSDITKDKQADGLFVRQGMIPEVWVAEAKSADFTVYVYLDQEKNQILQQHIDENIQRHGEEGGRFQNYSVKDMRVCDAFVAVMLKNDPNAGSPQLLRFPPSLRKFAGFLFDTCNLSLQGVQPQKK